MARWLKRGMDASAIKAADAKVRETVEDILAQVEERRDAAIRELSQKFDNWSPLSFKLTPQEIERAIGQVGKRDLDDVKFAQAQVRNFAQKQKETMRDLEVETLPGVKFENCYWCQDKQIAAICTDTWGVEVRPNETTEANQPWHWVVIPAMGLCMGEIFYLKELAEDCDEDGVYEFFFCGPPLIITGGTGSPINPQAIK